jgi:hypothetical protein
MNEHVFHQTPADAARYWNGELISGRYAQPRDTQPGWANAITEGLTSIPEELLKAKDFKYRGGVASSQRNRGRQRVLQEEQITQTLR